ncbi:glycosyltransferase [Acinetobacter pittii]|uniref:glycosyltransferase n=1 Tax=Acinetobacter pittii TaxID=48296 RepID=UPI0021CD2449|nr:glycosyltransferase [Acinetobacter pittii]MCU4550032.1 glycosyltransferase [Acinetobacter pittii]
MKILFYYFHGAGGAIENFYHLLQSLCRINKDIQLVILCDKNSKLNDLSLENNVEIIHTKIYFSQEVTRLLYNFYILRKIVQVHNPDIVWSLNVGPYFSTGKLQVLSVNNAFQVYPLEFSKFHPSNKLKVLLLRKFFRMSLSFSEIIFTQTELMASYIRKYKKRQVSVYSKAVDKRKFILNENLVKADNELNFLYISTFSPHKNHIILIKLFQILGDLYTSNPKKFNGKKPILNLSISVNEAKSIYTDVEHLVENGFINCLGWVDNNKISYLYEFCDICLMPSFLECLSSSHLEAFAYSKPQIVSNVPYAHDLCKDAALYANPNDVDDWVKCIFELINNPNLCNELAQRGNKIFDQFPASWDEIAQSIFDEFLIYSKRV